MAAVLGSMPPSPASAQRAPRSPGAIILRRILTSWQGQFGVVVLAMIVTLGLLAPWIAPYSPIAIDPDAFSMPPSAAHWFGTDEIGRDVLSRVLHGATVSLQVVVFAIGLALIMRLALLGTIAWIVQLTQPVFELFGHGFSWKDLILIAGGLFLVWKATKEIHHNVDPVDHKEDMVGGAAINSFASAIGQILLLDLVFSVDSIITAVGMTPHLPVMVVAVVIAVAVMLLAATPLANFIERNPTIVMLALAFLLMIGTTLIAEGMGFHVPKGYVYAAMAFSGLVEVLNMVARNRRQRSGKH